MTLCLSFVGASASECGLSPLALPISNVAQVPRLRNWAAPKGVALVNFSPWFAFCFYTAGQPWWASSTDQTRVRWTSPNGRTNCQGKNKSLLLLITSSFRSITRSLIQPLGPVILLQVSSHNNYQLKVIRLLAANKQDEAVLMCISWYVLMSWDSLGSWKIPCESSEVSHFYAGQ